MKKPILFSIIPLSLAVLLLAGCQNQTSDEELTLTEELIPINEELPSRGLDTQINEGGNVTVEVTPFEYSEDEWRFEITLSTHSVDLSIDLVEASFLTDASGDRYEPTSWEGDPPGGHHRVGELLFTSVPYSSEFTLNIQSVAEIEDRFFTWSLPAGTTSILH